jgi:hypothetical protein
LTATAIAGAGWTCSLATVSCSRNDALAAGASYPPIAVTVDVASDAPANVVNTAHVSRAGQNAANDDASDPTAIASKPAPAGGSGGGPGGDRPGGGGPADTPRDTGQGGRGTTTTPDTLAPTFTARLSNKTFAVDPKGAREPVVNARAKAKKGTRIVYSLSEPARAVFTIERKVKKRFVQAGSFAQDGAAGANTRKWSGKIGSKGLKPGSYRVSIVAKDAAGNASKAKRLSFKIVAR